MTAPNPVNAQSSYLPPEQDFPQDNKLFREILSKRERLTATILNVKENANYENFEILTAQQYFDSNATPTTSSPVRKRYTFRKVINFGALPNNATKSVAHGLTLDDGVNPSTWFFTRGWAAAFDPSQGAEKAIWLESTYYDIAGGAVSNPINLNLDQTNVNITTTSNRTNFSRCYVVLEYMKVF